MQTEDRMREKAKVVRIDRDRVSVIPLDIDACIGCSNAECKKNGNVFTAVNSRGFDLSVGSEIRVGAPAKSQLKQGLLAIGLPVLLAAAAYLLLPRAFPGSGEGFRVGLTFAALFAGGFLGYRLSVLAGVDLPEVVEVL